MRVDVGARNLNRCIERDRIRIHLTEDSVQFGDPEPASLYFGPPAEMIDGRASFLTVEVTGAHGSGGSGAGIWHSVLPRRAHDVANGRNGFLRDPKPAEKTLELSVVAG